MKLGRGIPAPPQVTEGQAYAYCPEDQHRGTVDVDFSFCSGHIQTIGTEESALRTEQLEPGNRRVACTAADGRAHMDVALMRVSAGISNRAEVVTPTEDLPAIDRVVRRWMAEHGVQKGDRIQAFDCEINGMDAPQPVWIVVGLSGLVITVAEPPVGATLPAGPPYVYRAAEDAQAWHQAGARGPAAPPSECAPHQSI